MLHGARIAHQPPQWGCATSQVSQCPTHPSASATLAVSVELCAGLHQTPKTVRRVNPRTPLGLAECARVGEGSFPCGPKTTSAASLPDGTENIELSSGAQGHVLT